MIKKNTFLTTVCLAAAIFTSGCAHKAEVAELTSTNNELAEQVKTLQAERQVWCGMVAEASMMGMVVYIGDNNFQSSTDGTVDTFDDMDAKCSEMFEGYSAKVAERAALNAAKKDVAADTAVDARTTTDRVKIKFPMEFPAPTKTIQSGPATIPMVTPAADPI